MIFSFDFSGSGLSEGDHVSLGMYEHQDLMSVIIYLQKLGIVSKIGVWGRSMGAATTVMLAGTDCSSVSAIVADSGFCSLEILISDLIHNFQSWIPNSAIKIATSALKKSISSKASFDISSLCPINFVSKIKNVPALFGHAEGDNFIKKKHSETLYDKYPCDKTIIFFEGDHNTPRPDFFLDQILIHFEQSLCDNLTLSSSVSTLTTSTNKIDNNNKNIENKKINENDNNNENKTIIKVENIEGKKR